MMLRVWTDGERMSERVRDIVCSLAYKNDNSFNLISSFNEQQTLIIMADNSSLSTRFSWPQFN